MSNTKETDLLAMMDHYGMNGRFVSIDGHNVFLIEKGNGHPIVLMHGYASCAFTWRKNIGFLSKYFQVIAFDLPGFGLSRAASGFEFTLKEYVDLTAKLFTNLRIDRAILYGHSLGGTICTQFCRKYRTAVRSLVLEAAPVMGENQFSIKALKNLLLFYYHEKALIDDDLLKVFQCLNNLRDKRLPSLQEILTLQDNSSTVDDDDRLPVLILWGENDQILSAESVEILKQQFAEAACHIVPQCGHAPHEENPKLTHLILKQFLNGA